MVNNDRSAEMARNVFLDEMLFDFSFEIKAQIDIFKMRKSDQLINQDDRYYEGMVAGMEYLKDMSEELFIMSLELNKIPELLENGEEQDMFI